MEAFIVCESLVKIYRLAGVEVQALQGLDLTVGRGELLGIVGASGSGKSTLLNVLGGLDRPTGGRVWVAGRELSRMNERSLDAYRRHQVGFVWQMGSRNLVPYLTALENIELPMTLSGQSGPEVRRRALELLELVGLAERRGHYLHQLSGGESQRVGIALALANLPRLILADEPTGEVDTATAQTLYELFASLHRELEITIVMVSHDPNIAKYVDRVVVVRDGKVAAETRRRTAEGDEQIPSGGQYAHFYHEVAVLDAAGRLQIPKEYRERFGIRRRVELDVLEEGILIRPVDEDRQGAAPSLPGTHPTDQVEGK